MKLSYHIKRTGLCHFCGKPTKLLIHQNCHAPDKAPRKVRPLSRDFAKAMSRTGGA